MRPNPYVVVAREDIQIHLFGLDEFDPEALDRQRHRGRARSRHVVRVVRRWSPYHLRQAPVRRHPRILHPRKRFGTVRGFSVVGPGGNWLRFSKLGDTEDEAKKR